MGGGSLHGGGVDRWWRRGKVAWRGVLTDLGMKCCAGGRPPLRGGGVEGDDFQYGDLCGCARNVARLAQSEAVWHAALAENWLAGSSALVCRKAWHGCSQ